MPGKHPTAAQQLQKKALKRLEAVLDNPNSTPEQIAKAADSITRLQRQSRPKADAKPSKTVPDAIPAADRGTYKDPQSKFYMTEEDRERACAELLAELEQENL